ncbi:MAG: MarR family transcriptional regulator [Cytophagales bacterium]|nr:MarR family transcriptional regulator [Cytophagales bacterium]
MRLEDEISQREFKSIEEKTFVNLLFTGNWLESSSKKFLEQFDVSPQQYNILRILRGQYPEPCKVSLVGSRMLDKMSDVSRIIERMRLKKLVERNVKSTDRRSMDVIISKKGLGLLYKIDEELHRMYSPLLRLTNEENMKLNELLDKLRG